MKLVKKSKVMQAGFILASTFFLATTVPAIAQDYAPPPNFSRGQLDNLVSRIALYPDPLLAQVFAAASFPEQIPDAARWADQYRNLRGNELADVMYQANLQFDPAVQALIPFPTVLDMMARDPNWTNELGNAVLADRSEVMDAVQRMRRYADEYGYLRSNQHIRVVNTGFALEIVPADPSLIYVPVYDPYVVYAPPRPGFFIGGAIGFGSYCPIGAFGGWGWGGGFNWYNHAVFVNHATWGRTWYNRDAYVHNYGNWDRGEWRNSYNNRNGRYQNDGNRYNRTYSNSGGNYRGGQSAPVAPNRGYDRSNGSQYGNGSANGGYYRGGQSAPVVPNQRYDRSNSNQYRNGYGNPGNVYRGGQSAPPAPNQSYDRGNGGQYRNGNGNPGNGYRGVQSPTPAPNQSYDRGNGNRNGSGNPGGSYRAIQSPPPAPNQSYDRGNGGRSGYGNPGGYYRGGQSGPVAPSRTYEPPSPAQVYRGGQSAPVAPRQSYDRGNSGNTYRGGQAAPPTPSRGYERNSGNQGRGQGANGGNDGRHFDRGGQR